MIASTLDSPHVLIAAIASLVGVPLGVITFYLRWLYENQMSRHAELVRRFELLERQAADTSRSVSSFAVDFTTKEEWLRELMYTRGRIEHILENLRNQPPHGPLPSEPRTSVRADSPNCL